MTGRSSAAGGDGCLGHALGLEHCPRVSCIEADAMGNAIRAARLSTNRYCEVCAAKLAPWLKTEGPHGPRAEPIFRKRDPTPDEATP